MSMYILLEYSQIYSMKSQSLWIYYREKVDDVIFNDNASNDKSFEYKK